MFLVSISRVFKMAPRCEDLSLNRAWPVIQFTSVLQPLNLFSFCRRCYSIVHNDVISCHSFPSEPITCRGQKNTRLFIEGWGFWERRPVSSWTTLLVPATEGSPCLHLQLKQVVHFFSEKDDPSAQCHHSKLSNCWLLFFRTSRSSMSIKYQHYKKKPKSKGKTQSSPRGVLHAF